MSEGRGKIIITFAALRELLCLPEDARIFGVQMEAEDLSRSQFKVFVEHSGLPEWREGEALVTVAPNIETHYAPPAITGKTFRGWH